MPVVGTAVAVAHGGGMLATLAWRLTHARAANVVQAAPYGLASALGWRGIVVGALRNGLADDLPGVIGRDRVRQLRVDGRLARAVLIVRLHDASFCFVKSHLSRRTFFAAPHCRTTKVWSRRPVRRYSET